MIACIRVVGFFKLGGLSQRRSPSAAGTDSDENAHPIGRRNGSGRPSARPSAAPLLPTTGPRVGVWSATVERSAATVPLEMMLVEEHDGDKLWRLVMTHGEPRT